MTARTRDFNGMRTAFERPYSTEEQRELAYAYLQRRHAEGRLDPIHDWTGDLVDGYAGILGIKP